MNYKIEMYLLFVYFIEFMHINKVYENYKWQSQINAR